MKRASWAVVILVLGLAACSSPDDLASTPQLETQYGTVYDDRPVGVATNSLGTIYNLYNFVDTTEYCDEYYGCFQYTDSATLTRYNSSGSVVWQQNVLSEGCYYGDDYCTRYKTEGVYSDNNNYSYVLTSSYYANEPDGPGPNTGYRLYRFAPLGELVGTYYVGDFYTGISKTALKVAVDASGNIYVVSHDASYGENFLTKYKSNGAVEWSRQTTVLPGYGVPTDVVVSPGGSLYIAGTKGLARYTTSGNLVWTKAVGSLENVIVSGSNIYTRYRKDIRKFDANGKQLWLKTQTGLNTLINQDIAGDTSGNVYISGKYAAGTGNYSPFVRKLNSSGTVLWTKTYGTTAYDDALSITTTNGSEIYVAGETQGSLAHTNYGGPQKRDGYLRKLNSSGNPVWNK